MKNRYLLAVLLLGLTTGLLGACDTGTGICAPVMSHGVVFAGTESCFSCHAAEVPMPSNHVVFENTRYCLDCHSPR